MRPEALPDAQPLFDVFDVGWALIAAILCLAFVYALFWLAETYEPIDFDFDLVEHEHEHEPDTRHPDPEHDARTRQF